MRSLRESLALALLAWLAVAILAAFAVYTLVSVRATSEQWTETVHGYAGQFSELIKRSTHHSMLLNRKEDAHHIISAIAEAPGVVGVRIYDKNGTIVASGTEAEVGRQVDLEAEACVICHRLATPLESVPAESRTRVYDGPEGERVLGLISPIENAPECSAAGCHVGPGQQRILGVLDVQLSMADADAGLARIERQAIVAALLTALGVSLVAGIFVERMVRRPVSRLIDGTQRVSRGDLATELPEDDRHELGQLARAFNGMTRDLRGAREELTAWSDRLEGRLVEKTEELGRTQRQVVQMEKMASLGKLAATVAHELNNPLAGILNYARLVERTLAEQDLPESVRHELERYLSLIVKETARSGDIVRNLLLFARRSGAEFALAPLNEILDRAVMLIRHHLEMAGIRLELQRLPGDDRLICDADQIQQALVALLVNAVEAMPDGGTLALGAAGDAEQVLLTVADTGAGIPEEVLSHIFEPFFSTKQQGSGLGLGLAVVYGIVERHAGEIEVDSTVGRGTTFRMRLPRRPRPEPQRPVTKPEEVLHESGP